eukprot:evm.model.scf_63.12 EVM.evm.TU.scf_63.12   scf_63:95565-96313(+)
MAGPPCGGLLQYGYFWCWHQLGTERGCCVPSDWVVKCWTRPMLLFSQASRPMKSTEWCMKLPLRLMRTPLQEITTTFRSLFALL